MADHGNNNPGNFANRYVSFVLPENIQPLGLSLTAYSDKDEVREIASKGGHSSHSGGFASMDPDKQVSILHCLVL